MAGNPPCLGGQSARCKRKCSAIHAPRAGPIHFTRNARRERCPSGEIADQRQAGDQTHDHRARDADDEGVPGEAHSDASRAHDIDGMAQRSAQQSADKNQHRALHWPHRSPRKVTGASVLPQRRGARRPRKSKRGAACAAPPDLSSLRANGSRECAPDDRLREAIHFATWGTMDCFVANAPRNDGGLICQPALPSISST
jgi:hypothetical protein